MVAWLIGGLAVVLRGWISPKQSGYARESLEEGDLKMIFD